MAVSLQKPYTTADEYLALQFTIQQILNGIATVALVKVVSCTNSGGVAPFGFVDVLPLVNQVTGDGQTVPHGVLYRLPYFRAQGGRSAFILDPQKGDIGLAAFAARDISSVKADPAQAVANANAGHGGAPPGSDRKYSMADGLYFGGFLNGVPEQYVQFQQAGDGAPQGIAMVSPVKIRMEAPTIELVGAVNQSGGNVEAEGNIHTPGTVTGDTDVIAGNISGKTHAHTSAAPGSPTSPPLP